MNYPMFKVYNEMGDLVSHTYPNFGATENEIKETYARGCGWRNAAEMRQHYPIDDFKFIRLENDYA